MAGTVVHWLLGVALATVASIAGRRLLRCAWPQRLRLRLRPRAETSSDQQSNVAVHASSVYDSAVHIVTALGMAAMLAPADAIPAPALRWGYGGLALVLLLTSRGVHRVHHAAMAGVMALMAGSPHRAVPAVSTAMSPRMAPGMMMPPMPSGAHGSSPILLAAFGYVCVSALVIAWRLPAPVHRGHTDAVGRSCEIAMFLSTAVMLLPMI